MAGAADGADKKDAAKSPLVPLPLTDRIVERRSTSDADLPMIASTIQGNQNAFELGSHCRWIAHWPTICC